MSKQHPLPATGGSYIRDRDGTLRRVEGETPATVDEAIEQRTEETRAKSTKQKP